MSKTVDLQPWLSYFEMIRRYERAGFVEMMIDNHEAYITHASIYAITPGNDVKNQTPYAVIETCRRLRAYAGYLAQHGVEYLTQPFYVHIMQDDRLHDPIFTVLISQKRRWWWPWKKNECIDIIKY